MPGNKVLLDYSDITNTNDRKFNWDIGAGFEFFIQNDDEEEPTGLRFYLT